MSNTHLAAFNAIEQAIKDKQLTITVDFAEMVQALQTLNTTMAAMGATLGEIKTAVASTNLALTTLNNSVGLLSSGAMATDPHGAAYAVPASSSDCCMCELSATVAQINQAIQYMTLDGPGFGLNSPPLQYPSSSSSQRVFDITPPALPVSNGQLNYLPDGYIAPPGGLNGTADMSTYQLHKCDMANLIFDCLIAFYQNISDLAYYPAAAGLGMMGVLSWLVAAGSTGSGGYVTFQGTLGTVSFQATYLDSLVFAVMGGMTESSKTVAAWLAKIVFAVAEATAIIIADLLALGVIFYTQSNNMIELLNANRDMITCILVNALSPEEARAKIIQWLDPQLYTFAEGIIGQNGNGHLHIISYVLSDELLMLLFATPEEIDLSAWAGRGVCGNDCNTCDDADKITAWYSSNTTDGTSTPVGGAISGQAGFVDCAKRRYAQISQAVPTFDLLCVEAMVFKWGQHSGNSFAMSVTVNGDMRYPWGWADLQFTTVDETNPEFNIVRCLWTPETGVWGGHMVVQIKAERPNGCDGLVITKIGIRAK